MKPRHILIAIFSLGLGHLAHASIPPRVANLFTLVDLKLKEPMPDFRVQIMRIAPDVFIDPPPQPESFESQATLVLTVEPSRISKALSTAGELARKSKWKPVDHPAYPRWRLRIIGPWNETIGDLLIDDDNLEILVGDKWQKVDAVLVRSLTSDLVKAALETES